MARTPLPSPTYRGDELADTVDEHSAALDRLEAGVARAVVTPEQFGCAGDGVANDAAGFRAMWLEMRRSWYEDGVPLRAILTGTYLLASPAQDRASVATLVMDFSGEVLGASGSEIRVSGGSGFIVQIGTYASLGRVRKVSGLSLRSMDGLQKGVCFDALFQHSTKIDNISVRGTLGDFVVSNCQELFVPGLKSYQTLGTGLDITTSGVTRADGSNNAYSTSVGVAITNNNEFEITVQSPAQRGIHVQGGKQNTIRGVVQGAGSVTYPFVDIAGGTLIALDNLWLESSNATHNEIYVRSTFTGSLALRNVGGETIGAAATFEGGTTRVESGNGWVGRWNIVAPATVITDTEPQQGYIGLLRPVVLHRGQPVQSATETHSDTSPQNRRRFYKGSVAAGGSFRFFSGGNNASNNESKGFVARVHIWDTAGNAQCSAVFYADGRATYPATRSLAEEKLGTLAGCSATLTATKAGSTPFHILYGDLGYSGAATLRYEITVEPFEF